ncbi:MAG: hypothetical protein LLF76_09355 [Planctomycetaceae bacterium]|nr:hypothetical protein [Planctomycetaceae bacterium]
MALLMVLFMVIAIAAISAGLIARSDAAMLCGNNFDKRSQADSVAWGGLEHARALVLSPDNAVPLAGWSGQDLQLDSGSSLYYDLTVGPAQIAASDPNLPSTYRYSIQCRGYFKKGSRVAASSTLDATLLYDPNTLRASYISLRRQ